MTGLKKNEEIGISHLRVDIRQIIHTYTRKERELSPAKIKDLTKVERLTVINKQNAEINSAIEKMDLRTL